MTFGRPSLHQTFDPTMEPGFVMTNRRRLLSVIDEASFKYSMIALGSVIGAFLLAVLIWAIIRRRRKRAVVTPINTDQRTERDVEQPPEQTKALTTATPAPSQQVEVSQAPPNVVAQEVPPPAPAPAPQLRNDTPLLSPGIVLAPIPPPVYNPMLSNPRLATDPPYERLVLVSSRVHNADRVALSSLPNVAYVVYDWKNFTLQELLRYVKKVLGAQKVTSIAVVAPGSRAGAVGLLEGGETSAEKLATKTELSQFWRVLAGCVALSGTADGRRIDLLGCRVVEAPREGAALLKELWNLTTVPFAAADDALGGYRLCTFMEEPTTRQLGLISSEIPAVDLYFNRTALLGASSHGGAANPDPAPAVVMSGVPPLPPGPPPASALTPVGPAATLGSVVADPAAQAGNIGAAGVAAAVAAGAAAGAAAAAGGASPAGQLEAASGTSANPATRDAASLPDGTQLASAAPIAAAGPGSAVATTVAAAAGTDVFTRLDAALKVHGKTPEVAFNEHDRDGNGQLSTAELTGLMRAYVPDATPMDIKHFQAMLETDTVAIEREDFMLSREEFTRGLPENVLIQERVRAGRDDDEVIPRLQEYLTSNEAILSSTFEDYDANGNGHLDHIELRDLIADIPGLEPKEKKFILAYLYHHDQNRDERISFVELKAALAQFGPVAPTIARAVPQPGQVAGAAAAPMAAGAAIAGATWPATAGAEQVQAVASQAAGAGEVAQAAAGQVQAAALDAAAQAAAGAQAAHAGMDARPSTFPSRPTLAPLGPPGQGPSWSDLPRPGALVPLR